MQKYIAKRILVSIPIILGVILITFILMNLIPGNAVTAMMQNKINNKTVARVEAQMHLNDPIPVRFGRYVKDLMHGDLGKSIIMNQPVSQLIKNAFPNTLKLAMSAILFAWVFGIPIGVFTALHKNTWLDKLFMGVSLVGISMPTFSVGIILQYLVAYKLKWTPISGFSSLAHLILPSIVLGWSMAGEISRLIRTNLIDVINADYITTAKAKGQSYLGIVVFHALKMSILPVITIMMLQFTSLLGGALITENIFGIPGIGTLSISALTNRDIPLLQGTIILSTMIIIVGNLIADIIYALIDPRIRYD
ncbi:peptide/nickel transport system permease protein [Hathewaya proteolytica DSM 3090]|uniref:Peptide/nickel transport system permease protein n=1 Tax=Hathewaya proteolytica DSM 3090 TaxID=1121331 RepID=A0A1M6KHU9_9CLOT|nr:ABC transporter permease [Hathewaya proteolytica]SHJ58509.1 peptide/nickel transport system permease protein [Hathewaya proteolytica DSM 3090]